jgi:hypothetical protein
MYQYVCESYAPYHMTETAIMANRSNSVRTARLDNRQRPMEFRRDDVFVRPHQTVVVLKEIATKGTNGDVVGIISLSQPPRRRHHPRYCNQTRNQPAVQVHLHIIARVAHDTIQRDGSRYRQGITFDTRCCCEIPEIYWVQVHTKNRTSAIHPRRHLSVMRVRWLPVLNNLAVRVLRTRMPPQADH